MSKTNHIRADLKNLDNKPVVCVPTHTISLMSRNRGERSVPAGVGSVLKHQLEESSFCSRVVLKVSFETRGSWLVAKENVESPILTNMPLITENT